MGGTAASIAGKTLKCTDNFYPVRFVVKGKEYKSL